MSITMNSVKCPDCGATLPIEEGRTQMFCSYCGSNIIITNENEQIFRHIDEADVKRAETNRMVRMRQLDILENSSKNLSSLTKILTVIWLVISVIILLYCLINIIFLDDMTNGLFVLMYVGGPIIGGGAYLIFKIIPEKELDKIIKDNGGIRIPKEIFPYDDKNYEYVCHSLKEAGFLNVSCVNMHDLTLGLLKRTGTVESITIDGKTVNSSSRVYMPDIPITITYHGK